MSLFDRLRSLLSPTRRLRETFAGQIDQMASVLRRVAAERDAARAEARDREKQVDYLSDQWRSAEAKLNHADGETARLYRELNEALARHEELATRVDAAEAARVAAEAARDKAKKANADLRSQVKAVIHRVEAQERLLSARADRSAAARAAGASIPEELDAALAPFAALFLTGWDDDRSLPPETLYPVPLGDLRSLARAVAGVRGWPPESAPGATVEPVACFPPPLSVKFVPEPDGPVANAAAGVVVEDVRGKGGARAAG